MNTAAATAVGKGRGNGPHDLPAASNTKGKADDMRWFRWSTLARVRTVLLCASALALGACETAADASDVRGDASGADVSEGAPDAVVGDDAAGPNAGTALAGLYTIDSHTLNQAGCGAEGPSILGDYPDAKLGVVWYEAELVGTAVISGPCLDEADCQSALDTGIYGALGLDWVYVMRDGDDAGGWTGTEFTPEPLLWDLWWETTHGERGLVGGVCTSYLTRHTLTRPADGQARLAIEFLYVAHAPAVGPSGEDTCSLESARAAIADAECVGIEVITGTYEKELVIPED